MSHQERLLGVARLCLVSETC